jgi:hypothetical protein
LRAWLPLLLLLPSVPASSRRQRRLVLLFGGLALLSAAWLTLWLWARGGTQLDWER